MDLSAVPLSAEQALTLFFRRAAVLRHPAMRVRSQRVRSHLEVYLDTEGEHWLTTGERTLVEAERQIDPAGAVARVTGPEALVAALPGFVDPEWLMTEHSQVRAQLIVVAELVEWLVGSRLVDRNELSCSLLEIEVRLTKAWERLDARAGSALSP
ncbi:hypothetical protein [Georgenia subflava]|uniref:Uncharacterized protein n=1 Tax=Georgenia subflava TaxID=1622177 RepID=A0A6N7EDX4_9MICO|nr:hypothetical protein [Georgenia subflava]MPV36210.1 hypothetical protein [Georgenia subflava]